MYAVATPPPADPLGAFQVYRDWVEALQSHTYDCAVIASPTEFHYEQLLACCERGIPALVEKPPATAAQLEHYRALVERYQDLRYAIGFQYRFHDKFQEICVMAERHHSLTLMARDDLVDRYGSRIVEVMGAHAFDLALLLLGPAVETTLRSSGVSLEGRIQHQRGWSRYRQRMDGYKRVSLVSAGWKDTINLSADSVMYQREIGHFLEFIETGRRDSHLATLADGLAVVEVMAQVR